MFRSRIESFVLIFFVLFVLATIYKSSVSLKETADLRSQIEALKLSLRSEAQFHDSKIQQYGARSGQTAEQLAAEIARIKSNTAEFANKLPDLERMVSASSDHAEDHRDLDSSLNQLHQLLQGMESKLGALEGELQQLQSQQALHEEKHEKGLRGAAQVTSQLTKLWSPDTVLLIIASNRPQYLQQTLGKVVAHHPKTAIPIIVSEDGQSPSIAKVVTDAFAQLKSSGASIPLVHMHHPHSHEPAQNGYFKLAKHFKWALDEVFEKGLRELSSSPTRVIILEDDLLIAPDFFEYFEATSRMLDADESLLAISAWNDNGLTKLVQDPQQLYRSDFFPGLGWMMHKRLWTELSPKWPAAYWDDWLREPIQRRGRQVIRPEVCRTFHIGKQGVSQGQYSEFIDSIKLNDEFVPFRTMDLSYLDKDRWDASYVASVKAAPVVEPSDRALQDAIRSGTKEVRLVYDVLSGGGRSYEALAKWCGAMPNIKANVPRTAYKGIVTLWKDGIKIHISPRDIQ